ncbi:MAG: T9SS type A sorting domain-containing protein [Phycisphaerae bacterium]|nr:T9SS type A sorting domain-containing protein [Saprospiraceae bacterium]
MRLLSTFLLCFLFLGFNALQAQVTKDATVPITATLNTNPISITLNWVNPGNADLLVIRRTKGQAGGGWIQLVNVVGSNFNTLTDNGVATGQIYEYLIQRTVNGIYAHGYVHVAVNAAPVTNRGKILIFVDSTTADALGPELVRLKNDMRGDGWWPIPFHTGPSSTVKSIKDQIIASYNADPLNVKSVLLLGSVPVPYSGDTNYDGHPDHAGAWPADAYYADINGTWTDSGVNNVTPSRAANDNIPGDGKFDQSLMPSAAELQIGRVDFRHLNAPAFGAADAVALMKRYLDKNHRWRIGDYTVQNKALVDDNFGFFGGESFASDGFRNAYPLVGEANVVETDFFNGTESQSYLMGYGCGAGSYTNADGVGSSANFATDSINIVFSNLFGSYHGDWDYESDPLMVSALASRGGILTCSWAGRPHWFEHYLASGETIGYCAWETMNAQFNIGFFPSLIGESGAHVALLGDPSLRANVVKPAKDLTLAAPNCNSVVLNWTASAEAVAGYHIYRALSQDGSYIRLTANPIAGTTYTDNAPPLDTLYYQVRAIKNVTNPGGGTYANNAIGPIKSIVFTGAGGATVTATGGTLDCATASVTLMANPSAPVTTWDWAGPNNFSSSQQNPNATNVGTYTVTAFDATGCSATATATIVGDYAPPTISATVSNALDCINTSATITVSPAGLMSSVITGPGNTFVQGFSATVTLPGTYTISVVSSVNGCIGNGTVQVLTDAIIPGVTATNSGPITCASLSSQLTASSNVPGATFAWSGPCANGTTATCAGVYTVVVTNPANGCTNTATTTVLSDVNIPQVTAQGGVLTCTVLEIPLTATTNAPNGAFVWTGPCVSGGPQFKATCPGNYTVVVTNPANGCTASATAVVTEDVQAPNVSFPPVPTLTCAAPCATVTVPNIPGIEIYYLGQLMPPGTPIPICQPGTYTVTVKSTANGCTKTVDLVASQDVIIPVADAGSDKSVSCISSSIQLDGNGIPMSVTYFWSGPGIGANNETLQNPIVTQTGVYTLIVTNPANGCTSSDQMEVIADASLPTAEAQVVGKITCASLTVPLIANTNAFNATFLWTGPNGFSSPQQFTVAAFPGTYLLVVTAPNGCSNSDVVEVLKAPDLEVTNDPVVVGCDGVITSCVNASSGTPPYAYHWSNGSTTNCAIYTGSSTVAVSVTDAAGCFFQNSEDVVVPPVLAVEFDPIVINCTSTTLVICATATGGVLPYSYTWSNGDTGKCGTFNTGGSISVSVTDAVGCETTIGVVITQPPVIGLNSVVQDESAPNAHNGSIGLTVTGGIGPFVYSWNNGATTQNLSGLAGGTYTVTITDAATGCTKVASFTVNTVSDTEEAALFEQFLLSPNPTEGLASLSVKLRETANLRVEIRDVAGRLIWEKPAVITHALDLPIDLSNSPAGMYTVSVWVENQAFVRKLAVVR